MRHMPGRIINTITIHCSATADGIPLGRSGRTAAQVIDIWHGQPQKDRSGKVTRQHMFLRAASWRARFNPQLWHIGYHRVIDVDGSRHTGRHIDEQGAHVAGHNSDSIAICMAGTDRYTLAQWESLRLDVTQLLQSYRSIERVCGHRDLSPDKNGDGKIERFEWLKTCPGFNAADWWLREEMSPMPGNIIEGAFRA
jgi:N-acetylmuramoyl-L-alanine amidase